MALILAELYYISHVCPSSALGPIVALRQYDLAYDFLIFLSFDDEPRCLFSYGFFIGK